MSPSTNRLIAYLLLQAVQPSGSTAVFQFYQKTLNELRLLSFLNPKSAIQNPKSCLNRVFVQALITKSPKG